MRQVRLPRVYRSPAASISTSRGISSGGESARRHVPGRRLALNHARYEEEVRQGLHDKGAKKAQGTGAAKAGQAKVAMGQVALFGD